MNKFQVGDILNTRTFPKDYWLVVEIIKNGREILVSPLFMVGVNPPETKNNDDFFILVTDIFRHVDRN